MPLTDNLRAYYKLDESSGNAADATGNGYTLTNYNTVGYVAGKINNGADGGASNTSKRFETTSNFGVASYSSSFTIAGWFKITTQPATNGLYIMTDHRMQQASGAESRTWSVRYDDSAGTKRALFVFSGSAAQTILAVNQTLTAGTWYHIVGVYDSSDSSMKLFVNGSSIGSTTRTAAFGGSYSNSATLFSNQGGDYWLSGMIDEIGFWERVLTSAEITELYNNGAGLQYPFTTTAANPGFFMNFV